MAATLIVREHLQRLERIAQMPIRPRAVEDCVADVRASGAASTAPAERLIGLFHASVASGCVSGKRL